MRAEASLKAQPQPTLRSAEIAGEKGSGIQPPEPPTTPPPARANSYGWYSMSVE